MYNEWSSCIFMFKKSFCVLNVLIQRMSSIIYNVWTSSHYLYFQFIKMNLNIILEESYSSSF